MKRIKIKINHKDNRGMIIDLLEKKKISAITLITQKKGEVRGNHYHKKTVQWNPCRLCICTKCLCKTDGVYQKRILK